MISYPIHWTPAALSKDGRASVCVRYSEGPNNPEGNVLFNEYEHTEYNNPRDVAYIMAKILEYHAGRKPDMQSLKRFMSRPTLSKSIVTEAELNDFFGETEQQRSFRI